MATRTTLGRRSRQRCPLRSGALRLRCLHVDDQTDVFARRKGWDYGTTQVTLRHERLHAHDCESFGTEDRYVDRLHREIRLDPALPTDQRAALLAIADKGPFTAP